MSRPLPPVAAELRRIVDSLTSHRRGFALVGGLAVSTRAEPRLRGYARDRDLGAALRKLRADGAY